MFGAQSSEREFRALAERVRATVEQTELTLDDGARLRVTVSIGIAHQSAEMLTAADLLRAADAGLYKAKVGGRNRIVESD